MARIAEEGRGVFLYIRGHEGRGIGLLKKLEAYNLQDLDRDTVEANQDLGLPVDARDYGVGAQVFEGLTGVWVGAAPPPGGDARKIGSIGLHISRGITTHGLAINVNNDLQPFEWIMPCGIEAVRMTWLRAALEAR